MLRWLWWDSIPFNIAYCNGTETPKNLSGIICQHQTSRGCVIQNDPEWHRSALTFCGGFDVRELLSILTHWVSWFDFISTMRFPGTQSARFHWHAMEKNGMSCTLPSTYIHCIINMLILQN